MPLLGIVTLLLVALTENPATGRRPWFPEDASAQGYLVDHLMAVLVLLTGAAFVGGGLVLGWIIWNGSAGPTRPNMVSPQERPLLLVVCSVVATATVLFVAVYQVHAWVATKARHPITRSGQPQPPLAEIIGRQFDWQIRYPGADGTFDSPDDLVTVNELHVPLDRQVVLAVASDDAPHRLWIPSMRVSQMAVPSKRQYVWFEPVQVGYYDIVSSPSCAWGHCRIKGRLIVETRQQFEEYLERLRVEQTLTTNPAGKSE
jgi:cytochrome c oxidase subunit 2